jgi:SAM-dependent methyltransferase
VKAPARSPGLGSVRASRPRRSDTIWVAHDRGREPLLERRPSTNTVLIGPSGVGKSTLFHSGNFSRLANTPAPDHLIFGYQLAGLEEEPRNAVIHYNMLHPIFAYGSKPLAEISREWDYFRDPGFRRLLDEVQLNRAYVLVAPIDELLERARSREDVEENVPERTRYDNSFWENVLGNVNLFRMYEQLFDILESKGIDYRVLFSSKNIEGGFSASDRVFVPKNLRGQQVHVPAVESVMTILSQPGCHYQSVLLPHGISTEKRGYEHIGGTRKDTFDLVLQPNLLNKSVLDIGCALGDLLFRAERLGANRLVGIELNPERYNAATSIRDLLHSSARFHHGDFLEFDDAEGFDHVFLLNVLHHVRDFWRFLDKACRLTRETLTVEFPTLEDDKFASANGLGGMRWRFIRRVMNRFPVIGVSSKREDQSFVYAAKAIHQLCMEEIGGFSQASSISSPLKGRTILVFRR